MVWVAILANDTEGEGHPMLGIVAINHEHEGWRVRVGVQEKQINIPVEWWTQACGWVACACDID